MLNFNEFQEHIKNTILDYLPEEFSDAKVDLQQVAKNNEMLTGIIIHQEKINISPTIYLDPFYKDYLSGSKDLLLYMPYTVHENKVYRYLQYTSSRVLISLHFFIITLQKLLCSQICLLNTLIVKHFRSSRHFQ